MGALAQSGSAAVTYAILNIMENGDKIVSSEHCMVVHTIFPPLFQNLE